jgi:LmbE family N-acetylglucosaminyl deacetylase
MTNTLNFAAHQDDDLLFMNPDILSDIEAGCGVWVVYLTAGDAGRGVAYANARNDGERAAYAVAAGVPNRWTNGTAIFAGHELPTATLDGTQVRLLFTYVRAASRLDRDGDLYRLWQDASYVASPVDGRKPFSRETYIETLRRVIATCNPDLVRTQDSSTTRNRDHIDHIAGALLAMEANSKAGRVRHRCLEYLGYEVRNLPPNLDAVRTARKTEVFRAYTPFDPEAATLESWTLNRQYVRRELLPGDPWVARTGPF